MGRLVAKVRRESKPSARSAEQEITDLGSVLEAYEPELLTDDGSRRFAWVAMTDHTVRRCEQRASQLQTDAVE